MKWKRVFTLIIFAMLLLLNLNSSYSSVLNNTEQSNSLLTDFQETNEIFGNETTQMNMTIIEVFDNETIDTSQTSRILGFNLAYQFPRIGLVDLEYYAVDFSLTDINITAGDTCTYSFQNAPYYIDIGTNGSYHIISMPAVCSLELECGSFWSANWFLLGMIFPLNFTSIEYLSLMFVEYISNDLHLGFYSTETNKLISNETSANVLTLDYYYNKTVFEYYVMDFVFYEMNYTLSIDLTTGAISSYTLIAKTDHELTYKLVSEFSEPYNNDGFDILEIVYDIELQEGEPLNVTVTVDDITRAYYEVSYRLKGDTEWYLLKVQTFDYLQDPFMNGWTDYYGYYYADLYYTWSAESYGSGKYLMDGEYELNITIWSEQAIRYDLITTFVVLEDLPHLNEIFPISAILFITIIILFKSKKKHKRKK